jgi:hypothetical protein
VSPLLAKNPESILKEIRENIAAIQQAVSGVEYLCSGTLLKRTKLCGKPNCRCKVDRAARHGPYYEWGFLKGGKLKQRVLSQEQAKLMQLAISNHRKVKKLLKAWEEQTVRLIELSTSE